MFEILAVEMFVFSNTIGLDGTWLVVPKEPKNVFVFSLRIANMHLLMDDRLTNEAS